jgi:hypothetical protein
LLLRENAAVYFARGNSPSGSVTCTNWPKKFPAYMSGDVQPRSRMSPSCKSASRALVNSLGDTIAYAPHALSMGDDRAAELKIEIGKPLIKIASSGDALSQCTGKETAPSATFHADLNIAKPQA